MVSLPSGAKAMAELHSLVVDTKRSTFSPRARPCIVLCQVLMQVRGLCLDHSPDLIGGRQMARLPKANPSSNATLKLFFAAVRYVSSWLFEIALHPADGTPGTTKTDLGRRGAVLS